MPTSFISSVKAFLLLLLHLFFTALFAVLTWAFWGLYQQQKRTSEFQKDGQPVTVIVSSYTNAKQSWTDYIQNSKYISFQYKGQPYSTRYVQDSFFVSEGTRVSLLYHTAYNAFLQPQTLVYTPRSNVSKLISWTSASLFSKENLALLSFLLVAVAFFFLLAGLLTRLPGLGFIPTIAGWVLRILLLIGAVFLTYDAYTYYKYYHHIKDNGQPLQLTVLDKYKHYEDRKSRYDPYRITYTARVSFQDGEKTIPVSESTYNTIEKGSRTNVLYDRSLNDMMGADYAMNPTHLILAILVWIMVLFFVIKKFRPGRQV